LSIARDDPPGKLRQCFLMLIWAAPPGAFTIVFGAFS
jgi:hypothetical protein